IASRSFAEALPGVLRAGVVKRRIFAASHSLPPAVLGLIARMGATDEAIERVLALRPSQHQIEALREVVSRAPEEQIGPRRRELAELEVELALTHPGTHEGIWSM